MAVTGNIQVVIEMATREQILRRTTLEEYIDANGGILGFLEGLATFAKENGLDWDRALQEMMSDVKDKARFFRRMGV